MRSHVYTAYILPEAKDEGGFRLVMQSATTDPLFQPRKRLLEEFLGWKRVFRERLSSNEVTDSTLGTMRAEARIAAGTRTEYDCMHCAGQFWLHTVMPVHLRH
eukprot:Polyplicarium_translucidae@DN288_c0_g1_i2.p2